MISVKGKTIVSKKHATIQVLREIMKVNMCGIMCSLTIIVTDPLPIFRFVSPFFLNSTGNIFFINV